ncbi:MAG TPA: hypothetical protein VFB54_00700 [Burkholderiales bacterium]|nr:hypothetical protein [Burkholderiales bacterium]
MHAQSNEDIGHEEFGSEDIALGAEAFVRFDIEMSAQLQAELSDRMQSHLSKRRASVRDDAGLWPEDDYDGSESDAISMAERIRRSLDLPFE